ncbi:hypothetical protein E3J48_04555 [Candidatus Aerophobetes bacterium]|uniref:DUF3631 domain-containing protein n=1 Tax=Aerophobetes bacterium TaxID=2030807 RepID=A0A523W5B9_UNCAE|nr:MAG: hypothetical protein E3J48_04555 [Candidatus Aerophobetes bacterium]
MYVKNQIRTLIPGLVHLVRENGTVKYLLKKDNKLYIEDYYKSNDKRCTPKQDLPIKIPGPEILKEPTNVDYIKLLDEIISFLKSYIELPCPSHYLILALWILHTYLIEKFNTTPILCFYGVKETGKSRAGEVLGELAFRCEILTSPTEATLFRSAEYFKTALVVDEVKLWGPEGNQAVARLINTRYKRGLKVSRVDMNKKGEDQIEYFDVFGPIVICTTETVPESLESRCITFVMQKNVEVGVEKLIDEEWANRLRNRLTIFRANYLDRDLPQTEHVARRRLNEIMTPLYQTLMVIAREREDELKKTLGDMEKAREEEEGSSFEAEMAEKIVEYQKDTGESIILTAEVVERLNKGKSQRDEVSMRLVGTRMKRLGFEKTRVADGKRGFKINADRLARLAGQFRIDL